MAQASVVLGPVVMGVVLWVAHRRCRDVPAAEEERLSRPFIAWLPVGACSSSPRDSSLDAGASRDAAVHRDAHVGHDAASGDDVERRADVPPPADALPTHDSASDVSVLGAADGRADGDAVSGDAGSGDGGPERTTSLPVQGTVYAVSACTQAAITSAIASANSGDTVTFRGCTYVEHR